MYDLGIIGGMGPLATQAIFKRIIEKTDAKTDQEHMSIVILNNTSIADRTDAIINNRKSIVNCLNNNINELVSLNTKNFIIGCNTAHYFARDIIIPKSINFINMIDEVLVKVKNLYSNNPIYILGTKGTVESNIYGLNKHAKDLDINYLSEKNLAKLMYYIYNVKQGVNPIHNLGAIESIIKSIKKDKANAVFIIACTELSLIAKHLAKYYEIVNAVDAVVDASIIKAGYKIKN